MYCSNCGTLLVTGAKFCHLCGEGRPEPGAAPAEGSDTSALDQGQPFIPITQVFEMFPPLAAPTVDEPIIRNTPVTGANRVDASTLPDHGSADLARAEEEAQPREIPPEWGSSDSFEAAQASSFTEELDPTGPVPISHDGDAPTTMVSAVGYDEGPQDPRHGDSDERPSWAEVQQIRPQPYGHADPGWRPDDPSLDPTDPDGPSPFPADDWAASASTSDMASASTDDLAGAHDLAPSGYGGYTDGGVGAAEFDDFDGPAVGPNATLVQPAYTRDEYVPSGPTGAATEVVPAVGAAANAATASPTVPEMANPANGPQWVVPPTSQPAPTDQAAEPSPKPRRRWPMALLCGYLAFASIGYAALTAVKDNIGRGVVNAFWDAVPTALPWEAITGFSDWGGRDQFRVIAAGVTVVLALVVLILLAAKARVAAGGVGLLVTAGLVLTAIPKALDWNDLRASGIPLDNSELRAYGVTIGVTAALAILALVLSVRLLGSRKAAR